MLAPSILSISAVLRKMALIIILFVLVGAAVDIRYMLKAGIAAVLMILTALAFQTIGVLLCMVKTDLTWKEKRQLFRLLSVPSRLPRMGGYARIRQKHISKESVA